MCGVYFIAGIYGTGKTTVGKELAKRVGISCYEASELIKKHNGEEYNAIKYVKDINRNQDILVEEITKILKNEKIIILTGHFAIFNKNREVESISSSVFKQLGLIAIILLESDIEKIMMHLCERDNKNYTRSELNILAEEERKLCIEFAKQTNTRILIHKMNYKNDVEELEMFLKNN